MENLRKTMIQAGMEEPAYRLVVRSVLLGIVAAVAAVYMTREPAALLVGLVAAALPLGLAGMFANLRNQRARAFLRGFLLGFEGGGRHQIV